MLYLTLPSLFLIDTTHTSHTRAQTGIQRVTRSLFAGLAQLSPATAVCYDPFLMAWRPLEGGELDHLRPSDTKTSSRGARWPLRQRLVGRARRLTGLKTTLPHADGLICPELFSAKTGMHLREILSAVRGPSVAVFHDAIGLKFPELTPPATVARLPSYLLELLLFDGIVAVSEDSAASLRDYWKWIGIGQCPPVHALPNGISPLTHSLADDPSENVHRVLCVGTIEGRKNHLALLEACETLWAEGCRFELELVGLARADTASRALAKIHSLKQAGRPIFFQGVTSDEVLHRAYRRCTFTVYPSLLEGFGLPVIESLQHGKPCICSGRGALGESAREGGCLTLDSVDATTLSTAMRRLLQRSDERAALSTAARHRTFRSWASYAGELTDWMTTLRRI